MGCCTSQAGAQHGVDVVHVPRRDAGDKVGGHAAGGGHRGHEDGGEASEERDALASEDAAASPQVPSSPASQREPPPPATPATPPARPQTRGDTGDRGRRPEAQIREPAAPAASALLDGPALGAPKKRWDERWDTPDAELLTMVDDEQVRAQDVDLHFDRW
mmetsp:Transcript_96794/g.270948  ORF Transcript_96794/g.270948 Transcript_96794/m.270948 type:complete len:161 (-) Transcript_96794:328-810(-)